MKESTRQTTIVVADDDPELREALERALAKEGYKVLLAEDGRAALDLLRATSVDVLLADLNMPGMSGLELLRATKATNPSIEVIVITGYGSIEEAVAAMKQGVYDFLTKPVKRVGLLKAIDKALERQILVRETRACSGAWRSFRSGAESSGPLPPSVGSWTSSSRSPPARPRS